MLHGNMSSPKLILYLFEKEGEKRTKLDTSQNNHEGKMNQSMMISKTK